jgi:colicin import membrane protein
MDRAEGREGQKIMPRKLKTYITNIGFFELALAAPSMKAALEAWGMGHNAFQNGFARVTDDPKIVAATMAQPGVVLRRAVGTKGEFKEDAALPNDLWKLTPTNMETPKPKAKAAPKSHVKPKAGKPLDKTADRAAILSFENAKEKRDTARKKAEEQEAEQRAEGHARIERAQAKADEALERAEAHHEGIVAAIAQDQDNLDRRAAAEKARWGAERAKLENAREQATR